MECSGQMEGVAELKEEIFVCEALSPSKKKGNIKFFLHSESLLF
jgi:hypothetical protein